MKIKSAAYYLCPLCTLKAFQLKPFNMQLLMCTVHVYEASDML